MEKQYHSIFKQIGKNRFYTACNATCSGRIKNGSEFFCGDGKVQYKGSDYSNTKGCGTNGANCVEVTGNGTSQYPGPGFTGTFNTSEACDPNDTKNSGSTKLTTNKLCNLANKTNYDDYTANSSITCQSDCLKINNADRCARCGNGEIEYGENCGEGSDSNIYSVSNTAKGRCAAAFSVANNSTYTINIPGVYCFTVKGGDGNKGDADNACSGATVKGCYKLQKGDVITFRIGSVGETRPADSTSVCKGTYSGGGGGGASWVYLTRSGSNTLLLVAGGGGGGGWYNNTEQPNNTCGGGSSSTSANNNANNTSDNCTDNSASDGTTVNTSNFASLTSAPGGDGGYHYTTKCSGKECDSTYACGGGGGGYVGGAKGTKDFGGGGGGSYVNTNTTYYSTGSSLTAGTNSGVTPSGGSITVQKPNSNATCSTSTCQWSTSYSTCN